MQQSVKNCTKVYICAWKWKKFVILLQVYTGFCMRCWSRGGYNVAEVTHCISLKHSVPEHLRAQWVTYLLTTSFYLVQGFLFGFITWELERVLAMVILSVRLSICLSVTTQYHFKTRWDRDFRFSPYDKLMSLIFLWQNFMLPGEGGPLKQGGKRGAPP